MDIFFYIIFTFIYAVLYVTGVLFFFVLIGTAVTKFFEKMG